MLLIIHLIIPFENILVLIGFLHKLNTSFYQHVRVLYQSFTCLDSDPHKPLNMHFAHSNSFTKAVINFWTNEIIFRLEVTTNRNSNSLLHEKCIQRKDILTNTCLQSLTTYLQTAYDKCSKKINRFGQARIPLMQFKNIPQILVHHHTYLSYKNWNCYCLTYCTSVRDNTRGIGCKLLAFDSIASQGTLGKVGSSI